jgi:signal peptidase I
MNKLGKTAAVGLGTVLAGFGVLATKLRRYEISEDSMEPALGHGDYVIASRLKATPRRGDVVIFQHPAKPGFYLSKRVLGLPGEDLVIENGQVTANGHVIAEPWARGSLAGNHLWQLGASDLVLLSDNRHQSTEDSRSFGPIPVEDMWRAEFRYWPLGRIGPVS